jgi:hypothetical protein
VSGEVVLKMVNETPITPEEMDVYLRAMEEDDGEPNFVRCIAISSEVFNKDAQKCMSINMRMTALAKLVKSESFVGWVKPKQRDGSYQVAANIYMAAGLEPMIQIKDDLGFNLESLLKRAFKLGKIDT